MNKISQVRPERSAGGANFHDVALGIERRRSSGIKRDRPWQKNRAFGMDAKKARGCAAGEGERGTRREEATGRGGEGGAGKGRENTAGKGELPQVGREETAAGTRQESDARERAGIAEVPEGDRG